MSDLRDQYIQWILQGKRGPNPNTAVVPQGDPYSSMDPMTRALPPGSTIPGAPPLPGHEMAPYADPMQPSYRVLPEAPDFHPPVPAGAAGAALDSIAPWMGFAAKAAKIGGPLAAFLDPTIANEGEDEFLKKLLDGQKLETVNVKKSPADQFSGPIGNAVTHSDPVVPDATFTKPAMKKTNTAVGRDSRFEDRVKEGDDARRGNDSASAADRIAEGALQRIGQPGAPSAARVKERGVKNIQDLRILQRQMEMDQMRKGR